MSLPETHPTPFHLTLASASPRRRELLALLGLPFEVVPSRYEEPPAPPTPVVLADFVQSLAFHKAHEVAVRLGTGTILGADTLVTLALTEEGIPLGKPLDRADAHQMLRQLSGKVHCVYTGVALLLIEQGILQDRRTTAVRTLVRFRELSDAMIADYLATGEADDKAGAYGAQGYAAPFIEGFEGDFFNVVGLPLCTVGKLLEQVGLPWWQFRHQMPPILG